MKQIVRAVESFTDAIEGNAEALVGVRNTLETQAQAVVDLSHQFERAAQDTRHSFANLSQMLTGFLDWLRRDRPGGLPMRWWEHIMSWLHFGRHAEHAGRDRLDAVLAQSAAANRKAVSAADSVVQAAEQQQREIAAERERIRLRTEEQARKARAPE